MTQFEQNFKTLYGRDFNPMYDYAGGWLYDQMVWGFMDFMALIGFVVF